MWFGQTQDSEKVYLSKDIPLINTGMAEEYQVKMPVGQPAHLFGARNVKV